MNFIVDNLKKAGIFNTVLIFGGLVYDVVRIFTSSGVYSIIAVILQIVAYCFALNYAFSGYKKDAARWFKFFLCSFALSMLVTIISTLIHGKAPIVSIVFAVIRLICVLILATVKDLGKTKSYVLAGTSLVFALISLVSQIVNNGLHFGRLYSCLSALILSAVLFVFVAAKYRDKKARGTE